jgi:hypothetical protein
MAIWYTYGTVMIIYKPSITITVVHWTLGAQHGIPLSFYGRSHYTLKLSTVGISYFVVEGGGGLWLFLLFVYLMVFNATFNDISVISWRSVLLVEETGGPRENHRPVTDKLYHIMLYPSSCSRFEVTTSVVICTDCTCSYKSNYHTITATTEPLLL